MTTENNAPEDRTIEGSVMEVKAPDNALVVLNPELYADELFAPFSTELTTAKRRAARASYDIATREGMFTAKELVRTFVKIRTRADKAKTEAKRPIDQAGKAILARFNALRDAAELEEAKHAKAIADEEKRLADIEAAKLAAERARIEAIEARIAHLRGIPVQMANADSASIAATLESMSTMRLEPTQYDEHLNEALTVLNEATDNLRILHDRALEREAEQRRIIAERAELFRLQQERQRMEQEARERAETERLAAHERERLAQAERAAAAERERAAQEALEAQARELAELRAQLAASQKAAAPAPAADPVAVEESAQLIEQQMEADCQVLIDPENLVDMLHGEQEIPVPEVRRAIPAPRRPSDLDIVEVVAKHFEVPASIALEWIATVNTEAVRRAIAEE